MVFPYSAMLRYIGVQCYTWLIVVLRLSDNQLYSRRMVWQVQSNQHCTTPLNSRAGLPKKPTEWNGPEQKWVEDVFNKFSDTMSGETRYIYLRLLLFLSPF